MLKLPSAFKTPQGEAAYMAAYEATLQLWPVPYEPRDVRGRFGSTHLVVCGPEGAPPLVLLHCFDTSLTVWAYNVADFSRTYRVYAPDMMGQPGKSVPEQPIRSRAELAAWLTGILDALGIGRTDLVGYSYGGFAALTYAIHAPDRVKKLVLLAPAGGLVPFKAQFLIRGLLNTLLPRLFPGLSTLTAGSILRWMAYGPNLQDETTRGLFDRVRGQFTLGTRHFRKGAMVPPLPYTDDELRTVQPPTLLLIGRHEALYDPIAAVRRAQRLIPDIRAELIPHAGHELPISRPETVNRRVLDFLQEQHPVDAGVRPP
jgi:pimeloyl-ACP methyl ester carboxylesterase